MKRHIILILLLLWPVTAIANDVRFSWLPNAEPVEGYRIHYGTESGVYTESIDVQQNVVDGRVLGTVTGIPAAVQMYYACTAYNNDAESSYSNEISYRVPLPPPGSPTDFKWDVTININVSVH